MGAHSKGRRWLRRCRVYFRRFRLAVWLLVLALLGAFIYLDGVGLPDFAKRPLVAKLRARGIDLQFSRMRLRFYQGIVADNVRFGQADQPLTAHLTAREVQVRFDAAALLKGRVQVDGLTLRHGQLVWPLEETNQTPRRLAVEDIQTYLRFLPNDQWALDNFQADFAGARIQLSGVITNASAVRDWKVWHTDTGHPAPAGTSQRQARQVVELLDRIHFSAPPELRVELRGDARDLQSFSMRISLAAPGADTPWGTLAHGRLVARLFPALSNGVSRAELDLQAKEAHTQWAVTTNFHLGLNVLSVEGQTNVLQGELNLSAREAHTPWGRAANPQLTAQWTHSITNPIPLSGHARFQCDAAVTPWAKASAVRVAGDFAKPPAATLPAADPAWAWWTNFLPYQLTWQCRVTGLQSEKLTAESVAVSGNWRAPHLEVTNLQAQLYQGGLDARASLDVATRALDVALTSDFDAHQLNPLLTEYGRWWLGRFAWEKPPQVQGELSLVLPAWTNTQPDWRAELRPTLRLAGEFKLDHPGSFCTIPASSASGHFTYSNFCWHLPDLTVTRPEGRLVAEHRANDITKDYYWRLTSTVNPAIVQPLLDTNALRAFNLFAFDQPPQLEAEIWGCYRDDDRLGIKGRVAVTNLTFRGQTASRLQTAFQFTNGVLECLAPHIQRGPQYAKADGLAADFKAQLLYLTNGVGYTDPFFITRAIGPAVNHAIEPYQFSQPVMAHVHGTIPLRDVEGADLHFDLDGGPFHWWKFNLPHIAGHVHWLGQSVTLTNVEADFYQGRAAGWAAFHFPEGPGTDFQFAATTTNTLLQALMADLVTATNHLEGTLSGTLVVSKANSEDWHSVFGYGDFNLHDGLIWDIPFFGRFSPVLNSIAPGLGSSRLSAADSNFIITNGVIRSDNLELRSSAMRLLYHGTVDAETTQVNARVEALLLRDAWLVGPVVSTVLTPMSKLFEYKVTGSLADPKTQLVNFPLRLISVPFHPVRSFKSLLPEETEPPRTNGPAALK